VVTREPRLGLVVASGPGVFLAPTGGAPRMILDAPDNAMKLGWSRTQPNRLFVGRSLGLSVLSFRDGRWHDEGRLPNFKTEVRSLTEEPDGTLWIGTPTRGYFKVTRPAGEDDWSKATFTEYLEDHGLPVGQAGAMSIPRVIARCSSLTSAPIAMIAPRTVS
jgi:hypothetical protein